MDAVSVVCAGSLKKKLLIKKTQKLKQTETKARAPFCTSAALLLLLGVSIFHPRVSPAQVIQRNPAIGVPQHQSQPKNAKFEDKQLKLIPEPGRRREALTNSKGP